MKTALNRLAIVVALILVALSTWDQIVREPIHRTWHGQVFGVPYDFRLPTWARIKARFWAPHEDRVLSPHVFGVGWSLNVGRLYALVLERTPNH